ncbi:hypothetical protein AC249_AIPGENE9314 [Exaiptasia diaphana]|nr:hypothetical protein AC249_AIPGENE9314 [Exaiptasia diaphana]
MSKDPAQFVVCYNTKTLTPDFTSHVIVGDPAASRAGRKDEWYDEKGVFAPNPESSVAPPNNEYKVANQKDLFPNYNSDCNTGRFCARGHLTPNSDFATSEERIETFINTNIAPQWQLFNGGNWAKVEEAVREYNAGQSDKQHKHLLYIFTGTAGFGGQLDGNVVEVKLNNRVYAPTYYWKVVCDPQAPTPPGATTGGQSVVIMADNNIGDISDIQIESKWNPAKFQTKKRGFIQLYSLDEVNKIFMVSNLHLPPLGSQCNPDKRGTFLDSVLDNKLT